MSGCDDESKKESRQQESVHPWWQLFKAYEWL